MTLSDCSTSAKPYTRSENRKGFSIMSDKGLICDIVDLDKCFFKNAQFRKCDWLFLIDKKKNSDIGCNLKMKKSTAFYVELKGQNHDVACEQLYNAIDKTKSELLNYNFEAKIISDKGRQPGLENNRFHKKIKQLIKKDVIVHIVNKNNKFTHTEIID